MKDFDSKLDEIVDDTNMAVYEHVLAVAKEHNAVGCGLDPRAYYGKMWVSEAWIAVNTATRSLDYYGGFEYVTGEDRKVIGDWTFYMATCERVRGHIGRAEPEWAVEQDEDDE